MVHNRAKGFSKWPKTQKHNKRRQITKCNRYSDTELKEGSSNTSDAYIQQSEHKFEERKVSSPQQLLMILANIWNLRTSHVGLTHLGRLFMRENGRNSAYLR